MGKTVPFNDKEKCDDCGALGAFDFMGDFLCPKCTKKCLSAEPCDRCGHNPCICGITWDEGKE